MAILIGIAGPSCTGKTRLVSLLEEELGKSSINKMNYQIINDAREAAWKELVDSGKVSQWEEIYNDKELLLMFCYKMLDIYEQTIRELKSSTFDFCIIDGTYIDILIYLQLQFWYHFPSAGLLSDLVSKTISLHGIIDKVYMTVPDSNYDYESKDLRQKMSDFRRNRKLECQFYDIYRNLPEVATIESPVDTSVKSIMDFLNIIGK